MRFNPFIRSSALLFAGVVALHATPGVADGGANSFFPKNSAQTIYGPALQMKEGQDPNILPVAPPPLEEAPPPETTQEKAPSEQKAQAPIDPKLSPGENVVKRFGDPKLDAPIETVDNAPKPFKAMMAALEAGDKDLAYQYARQYVRHVHNLQARVQQVVGMTGIAMEKEGYVAENSWVKDPKYDAERLIAERNSQSDEATGPIGQIPLRARSDAQALLDQAKAEEKAAAENEEDVPVKSRAAKLEEDARARARASFKGKVPVDPKGKVDIYLFINPADRSSVNMAREIQKFKRELAQPENVNIVAFSIEQTRPEVLQAFKAQSNIDYPVVSGAKLAAQLKVTKSPTTVFVAQTIARAVPQAGVKPAYAIDELVKVMQGRN